MVIEQFIGLCRIYKKVVIFTGGRMFLVGFWDLQNS